MTGIAQVRNGTGPRSSRFLERLRLDFPLESRLANSDSAAQAAYGTILRHWVHRGRAPQEASIAPEILDRLKRLDAVVGTEQGLACYPFSSLLTGITVTRDAFEVQAMCAIDALAIPLLVGRPCRVAAPCSDCGESLQLHVAESGGARAADGCNVWVRYPGLRESGAAHCSDTLCRGIGYVCAECAADEAGSLMRLEEAVEVGRGFFAFQRRWLGGEAPACTQGARG